jgi:hypothetical protein
VPDPEKDYRVRVPQQRYQQQPLKIHTAAGLLIMVSLGMGRGLSQGYTGSRPEALA